MMSLKALCGPTVLRTGLTLSERPMVSTSSARKETYEFRFLVAIEQLKRANSGRSRE